MNETRKPRVWQLWLFLFLAALVTPCLTGLVIALVVGVRGLTDFFTRPAGAMLVLWSAAAGWLIFGSLGARLDDRDVVKRLRLPPTGTIPLTVMAALIGLIATGQLAAGLAHLIGLSPGSTLKMLGKMASLATYSGAGLGVTLGLAVTGACEELFFRGYLQTRLVERWGRWGIVVTAAFFGLIHLDPFHSPVTFVMGLFLGWVAYRTGSILFGLVAHALNNGLAPAATVLVSSSTSTAERVLTVIVSAGLVALSVAALLRVRPAVAAGPSTSGSAPSAGA